MGVRRAAGVLDILKWNKGKTWIIDLEERGLPQDLGLGKRSQKAGVGTGK